MHTFRRHVRNFGKKYIVFWEIQKNQISDKKYVFLLLYTVRFFFFPAAQDKTSFLPKLLTGIRNIYMYSQNKFLIF